MFHGKTFIVIGLGKSGTCAAKALLARGARVIALDEQQIASKPFVHPRFSVQCGPFPAQFWKGAEAVVVSPGVPLQKPEIQAAKAAGARVCGEVELAWHCLPKHAGPILGITGTNGKSTTTALLGALLQQHAPNTFVGGNLGTPFTCAYETPSSTPYAFHVLELSSFQLEGITRTQVKGAALLNLEAEHLERYDSFDAYAQTKAHIFDVQPQDGFAVINADDARVMALRHKASVPLYAFTVGTRCSGAGFRGVARGNETRIELPFAGNETFWLHNRVLRGTHNVQNTMAAVLLARLAGASREVIQRGLNSFSGLPHRMESVRTLQGVEYINDSKATNVASTVTALKLFSNNVWLIAGGQGKGVSYRPLVEASRGVVKGVLTIGEDAPRIASAFSGTCTVYPCENLAAAVGQAHTLATPNDVILLSPACASYDQFRNFEHRGDMFKILVRQL